MGAGFKPEILDSSIIDEIIKVSDDEAKEFSKKLAVCEGIFAGLSSGAAAYAAYKISEQNTNKNIVFVLPDTAERYMSTYLFE
ncbi:MAG: pyridoxal-phosphate dependent enzyme [Elusimicrobiales bacterium]|nr:pyridoxal-phosphate dependent enzyme [Elusimicrobiales bacterium]